MTKNRIARPRGDGPRNNAAIRGPRGVAVRLLAVGLVACQGRDEARAPGQGLEGPDHILAPTTEDAYAVGAFDGADWETFAEVAGVAFDGAGNLYVLDAYARRVVVVDGDGELVRTVGQEGEGPGELQRPSSLAVFDDGSMAVLDVDKLHAFDADGRFTNSAPVAAVRLGGVLLFGATVHPLPDSRVLLVSPATARSLPPGVVMFGADSTEFEEGLPLNVLSLDGGDSHVLFRAWEPPPPAPGKMEVLQSEGGNAAGVFVGGLRAFEPKLHVAPLSNGWVAVADSTDYAVKIVAADGSVAGVVERPILPVVVTEALRQRERERRLRELDEDGGGPRLLDVVDDTTARNLHERNIELLQFMDEAPVIRDMAVDRADRLWIARTGADGLGDGPVDIVAMDGGYVGTLETNALPIPDAFGPDGLMAYVETDELGVQSVRVIRLVSLNR